MTRVNTNIGALNALKSLSDVNNRLSIAQLKLATGKRINSAADDAAGYSIAKKFNVRSEGLGQAINNIGSAKNVISVVEGHLNNIVDILIQMKTKAIQGADESLGTAERTAIDAELKALASQINLNVTQAVWNGKAILNGSKIIGDSGALFNFQIGAGNDSTKDTLKFDLLNEQNVKFSAGNTGFLTKQLQLEDVVDTIDLTKSFAAAGFKTPPSPDSRITINGAERPIPPDTFEDYPTVQDFLYSMMGSVQANIYYDITTNKFSIINKDGAPGIDLVISETGTLGFFTAAKIPTGTYNAPSPTGLASVMGTEPVNENRISVSSTVLAQRLISNIDNAIKDVSSALSYIGSTSNRLTYQEKSLNTSKINTDAARSRIEDADMASEQLQATKLQILQQTASTMLAQANTSPQAILSLFK